MTFRRSRQRRRHHENDGPEFGYGRHDRPLWTKRDYDAEEIRQVLRPAGFIDTDDFTAAAENAEPSIERFCFAVEGGHDGDPFYVACIAVDRGVVERERERATQVLRAAGYHVVRHPEDYDAVLAVTLPSS